MLKSIFSAAALTVALAGGASAATVFSDNFDGYGSTTVTNASDAVFLGVWKTTSGTVDYLAPPPASFSNLCLGTGSCVDLDGSTRNAGVFSTVASFAAGSYELAIELFGSGRGTTESVTISMGSWSTTIANILSADNASQTFSFTTSGGNLSFANAGGDNIGAVLSSVQLAAVPVPAAGLMLLGALGGLGAMRRRKAKAA